MSDVCEEGVTGCHTGAVRGDRRVRDSVSQCRDPGLCPEGDKQELRLASREVT